MLLCIAYAIMMRNVWECVQQLNNGANIALIDLGKTTNIVRIESAKQ